MRMRLRRLGSSISIEIVAGIVVTCIVFVGGWIWGVVWAALFTCSGEITTRVQQGEAYLLNGELSKAEPIVLQAIKDAPQCECVKQLATEYYRLVMIDALRLHQVDKAKAAGETCMSYASRKEFLGSISPRRRAALAFCRAGIETASKPDFLQQKQEKAEIKPRRQSKEAETTLERIIADLGLPSAEEIVVPPPEPHADLMDGETAPAAETRGKGIDALELEDACKTPPTRSREQPVPNCPGAPPVGAKAEPASTRQVPEPRRPVPANRR